MSKSKFIIEKFAKLKLIENNKVAPRKFAVFNRKDEVIEFKDQRVYLYFDEIVRNFKNLTIIKIDNMKQLNKLSKDLVQTIPGFKERIAEYLSLETDCKSFMSESEIKELEKFVWRNCKHEWVYLDDGDYYSRIKYKCKHCNLYRNQYMYN